jgi:hypothetical protein
LGVGGAHHAAQSLPATTAANEKTKAMIKMFFIVGISILGGERQAFRRRGQASNMLRLKC